MGQREMAALARPLLAALLLLGAVLAAQGRRHSRYLLTSNSQSELLKEAGNQIDHGPGYASQHKQHQWQKTGHKGHAWANKFKGGLKKRRFGHPGEHLPANTAFDHDNINLQTGLPSSEKEDGQDVQEDVGEGEAAEEEGEVREVAQEDQEAGPLKRSLPSRRLLSEAL